MANSKRMDAHFGQKITYLISTGWNPETTFVEQIFIKMKIICDCLHFLFIFFSPRYGDYPFISKNVSLLFPEQW